MGTPMQCIQIKMAHDAYSAAPKFKGFVDAAAGIVREEGGWMGLERLHAFGLVGWVD